MHKRKQCRTTICLLMTVALCVCLFSCGRKGPPVPRKAITPPPVQDLKAEIRGETILLTWSVPKKDGIPLEGIKRFTVFAHTAHVSEPPCPGCPLSFKEIHEILLANPAPAIIEEGRVRYFMSFDPESWYAFKVVAYHKRGGMSDNSNIVRVSAK